MMEDCSKYIKQAKKGVLIASSILLLVFLKSLGLLDDPSISKYNGLFILYILVVSIIAFKMALPYITCISKYKKN